MPELLSDSHFLRPAWLWVLVPTALLFALLRRRFDLKRQWQGVIEPHLLAHLEVGAGGRSRFRPHHLVTLALAVGTVAAAGPTWEQEVSPFAEDTAPLVVVLDLSLSMNAVDVQPTRLDRAKQKIRDLLALRPGARTGLVVYAGTAHSVLPLSDDPSLFDVFLADLSPGLMPVPGKEPTLGLARAEEMLARDSVPGTILFLTDGIADHQVQTFVDHQARSDDAVMVLAVGTPEGGPIRTPDGGFRTDAGGRRVVAPFDVLGLEMLSDRAGVFVAATTVDEEDVEQVQRRVQSHLAQVNQDDPTGRWKDQGYWGVWPVLLLALFWFRRGWTVRWAAVSLVALLGACGPAPSEPSAWQDLWLTPDQQGRRLAEEGRWAEAASRFQDREWRAVARYRAGDLDGAVDDLVLLDTPESNYNLGNTYARLERYPDALASYDRALGLRPAWDLALENRALVAALVDESPDTDDEPPPAGQGDPSFDPDSVAFDEQGKQGERGEVELRTLTDEQISEMWMRRLQASPATFLRQRFAIEAAMEEAGGGP